MRWLHGLVIGASFLVVSSAARADLPAIPLVQARAVLPDASADCRDVACLLTDRYRGDPEAASRALALHNDLGHIAGVGPEEIMDGGYRGKIRLVPQ
ncbi:MAG: hypothetical protein WKG01_41595, partial [Kofleriaceae bacterium]